MFDQDFSNYLRSLRDTGTRQMRFPRTTAEEFERWQPQAHERLAQLLAITELPSVSPEIEVHSEEDNGSYRIQKVSYQVLPGVQVPAYLLLPSQNHEPGPALLAPHGHGYGKDQVLNEEGAYHQYIRRFAEEGYVVLAPDQVGFGERTNKPGCGFVHESLNLLGLTVIGVRLWELVGAMDLLETLPQVDASRIGCAGLSLGGEMTLYLAAYDPRVKAACIACFLTSFEGTFLKEPHCTCGYVPGMARYFEHADIAALIAPRPLMIQAGTKDPSFLVADARVSYEELAEVYQLLDHAGEIAFDVFEGGHEFHVEPALDWFKRWI